MSTNAAASGAGEALAREAEHRSRAGIAAILGGILLLAGALITSITVADVPEVTLLDAFRDAGGPDRGLRTARALFLNDHALALTLGQLMLGVGALLASGALLYLFLAVRARRPEQGQAALIALAIGGIAYFIGTVTRQIASDVSLASFADAADHSTAAAHDALQPAAYVVGALFQYLGQVALAVGFVIVALNAMRVGLVTRFMGVLGILSGLLFALQVTALPVVQAFWLAALGALILGRWPNAVPPAWTTGTAQPWPSRQELVEARARREASAS